MAIAIRTDSFVAPSITQLSLFNAIKQAFQNAGFVTPFDDYTSGTDRIVVYAITLDPSKTYGTTYLRIRLTSSLVIGQQILATWNTSNKTGTDASSEVTYSAIATNNQVDFVALNATPELNIVMLTQGSTAIALGSISPENKPSWWNLEAWNYCFIPIGNTFATCRSTTNNPYGNSSHDTSLNISRMGSANNQTNRRDMLPGIILYTQSNRGISGRTSDDLVMVAASGTTRYDTLQIPGDSKQYLIIDPSVGGLAVRIS
ncbi:hypothetical protein IQ230_13790 [Gloeocapsopsis crepidinum LEGE 06123]|uniref:Uncharacterized protein n=1 Tax=Gloeocapsopsis crepidinum LEGE 06123 TaxID=588587 RepID=A0ABR9UTN1_9CHRO|nr:hypothetical protein [Gloeocapsopsis crepidinum]MBE9191398.1 hypothetical protein [Gloeocapsopsis crepidinum LEGE 06123]